MEIVNNILIGMIYLTIIMMFYLVYAAFKYPWGWEDTVPYWRRK